MFQDERYVVCGRGRAWTVKCSNKMSHSKGHTQEDNRELTGISHCSMDNTIVPAVLYKDRPLNSTSKDNFIYCSYIEKYNG